MRAAGRSVIVFVATAAWLACGNDYGSDDTPAAPASGERLGPCYANGTCNAGLACIDHICVLHGEDAGAGDAGTSSSSSGGTSGGGASSGGGTSGTTGLMPVPSFAARDTALCALSKKCNPNFYKANFPTDALCPAYYRALETDAAAYPGQALPNQDAIDACTAKIKALSCAASVGSIAECAFKGTLAKDTACNYASQCSGGACTKADVAANCGACADAPVVHPKASGSACDAGDVCEPGTVCAGLSGATSCQVPKAEGAACDSAKTNDCNPLASLTCKGSICTQTVFAELGEACGELGNGICGGVTNQCVGPAGARKCTANAKEGDDCAGDASKPFCGAGLTCSAGQCVKLSAFVCK